MKTRTPSRAAAIALAASLLVFAASPVSAVFPKLRLTPVTQGELLAPVGIANAADGTGRIFVVEQRGEIRIIENGVLLPTPFLDIESRLVPERAGFDERGLLGLAFHPDYGSSGAQGEGKFYVYYSAPSPNAPGTASDPVDHMSVIAEFCASAGNPNMADPASERILLTFDQPQFNHDAGQLAFGPTDSMLYIASGDGGSGGDNNAGHTGGNATRPNGVLGNAQDRTNLLGKILRIDPFGNNGPGGQFGIPGDNPFVGEGGGVREEIYAYGLRNPWRFSFDDGPGGTNRLFCADVGQADIEEINIVESGGNYGWRNKEGSFDFDATAPGVGPFEDPVAEYAHPISGVGLVKIGVSVTGGCVYRGLAIPKLVGKYIFADWSTNPFLPSGTLLGLNESAPGDFEISVLDLAGGTNPIPFYIAALGEDEDGEIYVAAKTTLAPSELDPDTNQPTGVIFKIEEEPVKVSFPPVELEVVTQGELLAPVGINHAADGTGRLFIVEQRGEIRILDNGVLLPTPFLDIGTKLVPERAGFDERGLLGLAFHPDYGNSGAQGEGKFYVYYSAPSPNAPGTASDPVDHMSVIAEFCVSAGDPNVADVASERILLTIDQPQFNHDGGQIAFGPTDDLLYIATGDGGSSNDNNAGHTGGNATRPNGVLGNSQDRANLLGKILRIDPFGNNGSGGQFGIPAANPFVGEGGGVREEIYAYGLRNPWRFSFDDGPGGTNRLFCADVGQRDIEEINIIDAGGNYGWRNREGTFDFDATAPGVGPFVDPIAEYAHSETEVGLPRIGNSVTGGYVYRGSAIPEMEGRYIFADWSNDFTTPNGTLLGLQETTPGCFALGILEVAGGNPIGHYIAALGEDEDGEIYVAAKTTLAPSALDPNTNQPTGVIFKIVPPSGGGGQPVFVEIGASKDNTIYSEGNLSNGMGSHLFSGGTGGNAAFEDRRALIAFDVAGAVPAGASIVTSRLQLRMNRTVSGSFPMGLHRLLKDWGEGNSNATGAEGQGAAAQNGDATWNDAFFSTVAWDAVGADFEPAPSATLNVGGTGNYAWLSAQLASDTQLFLDDPAQNFGWILIGDESVRSAKRFDSRTSTSAAFRPKLTIQYTPPPPTNRENWIAMFFDQGEQVDDLADLDGDTLNAIVEYGAGFDPKARNPVEDAYALMVDTNDPGNRFMFTFRRDPRAMDLTYRVEVSDDLVNWSTLAESSGGNVPTGPGFVSDQAIAGAPPFRVVKVQDVLTVGEGVRRFVRFVVVLST